MRFTTVAASLFALFSVASAGPIQRRQAEGTVLSSPVENGTYYKFSENLPTGGSVLTLFEINMTNIPSDVAALDFRLQPRDSRVPPIYHFGNAADFLPHKGAFSRGIAFPEDVISGTGDRSYDFQVYYIQLDCGSDGPVYTPGPYRNNITVIDGAGK